MARGRVSNGDLMTRLVRVAAMQETVGELLASPSADARHELTGKSPLPVRRLWTQYQQALTTALGVAAMVARGFSVSPSKPPEGLAIGKFERWSSGVTNNDVATFILRSFVLVASSELEHFLRSLATLHLTSSEVQRVRASIATTPYAGLVANNKCGQLRKMNDQVACGFIADWTEPSAGDRSTWRRRVELVFDTKMPGSVARVLQSLIRWRHAFTHRRNPPLRTNWSSHRADFVEAMLTWYLAGIALSDILASREIPR